MTALLRLSRAIDGMTETIGRSVSWLALAMVLLGAFNAIARYIGRYIGINLSSNAYLEMQWYLFSVLFLLCAGWALKQDSHVRVDVLFAKMSERGRIWINILGTLLLLFPFSIFVIWVSWPAVRNSWRIHEVSPDPGGLPRYPLKILIPICFVLLMLQGLSELIREVHRLRSGSASSAVTPIEHDVEGV
jgi:TRAP-type mannitol/chloroaromatic compound transport system permease small subunit